MTIKEFLDSKGLVESKGYTYLETILETFSAQEMLDTSLIKIYNAVAELHDTTIFSIESDIRYIKNHTDSLMHFTNNELLKELSLEYYEITKLNKNHSNKEW